MSKGFFNGFACRMKTIDVFILAEVITFLCVAGGNDVFGAAKTSTPTAKNNGKLVDSLKAGTSNNSAVVAQETKYPLPNEMLQGVVYDLKRTKDLRPTDLIDRNTANMKQPTYYSDVFESITKPFVNGSDFFWLKSTESKGNIRYPYFDDYYCLPNRLFNSFFYLEDKDCSEAPKMLHAEGDLQGGGWIAIYSGYVVAPFTGTFRFIGFADDVILVRFNKSISLDYGWYSLSIGEFMDKEYRDILSGKATPTAEQKSRVQKSPLFSKRKLDVLPLNSDNGSDHGLQRGVSIKVQKGQVYPIEIVLSEQGEGLFSTMLFVERLDDSGKPQDDKPEKLPLFRTTEHLPPHPTLSWFPDFEDEGPIWKVVDSSGKPIPASRYAGQNYYIGFQEGKPIPYHRSVFIETPSRQQKETKTGGTPKKDNSKQVVTKEKNEKDFASTGIINLPGGVKMEMIKVEAGTFEMSSRDGENAPHEVAHRVTLRNDFYLAKTEVTQAQWKAIMGKNPSGFKGDDLPVETVSWNDAMAFCEKLNETGKAPRGWMFTLPTETQWEYAARGGKLSKGYKYSGSNNLDEVAWYYENSGDERQSDLSWSEDRLSSNHCKTHQVGTKKANELGLYDMSGNLYEWCLDDWRQDGTDKLTAEFTRGNDRDGSRRAIRGGGWGGASINCRSSFRFRTTPDFRKFDLGFRVALVPIGELANAPKQNKTENSDNKTSSGLSTTPKKEKSALNPFGYTSPLIEDN